MIKNNKTLMRSDIYLSLLWLLIGTLLLLFVRGKWIIPITGWIAPVFILRAMRLQKIPIAIFMCIGAHAVTGCISYQGSVPLSGIYYLISAGTMSAQYVIPYVLDRLFYNKWSGFITTLIFPTSYVAWEYLLAQPFHPFPTFGSIAYSQFSILNLSQIVSVTGLWGLIFVVTWFSSVINWTWEKGFEWQSIIKRWRIFVIILFVIIFFGGIRTTVFSPKSDTVHIASLVRDTQTEKLYGKTDRDNSDGMPTSDINDSRETFSKIMDLFLDRTQKQAQAGAKIVMWCENSVVAFGQDENEYIDRAREVAKNENIFLMICLLVISEDYPKTFAENKTIFIDPDGEILWKYLKSYPVSFGEPTVAGEGIIPCVDTPYGKIGAAICFDMDHISFVNQAGKAGVDIMLVPSFDWKGVDPFHTNMVSFRSIENGFSIVRSTADGLSAAYDYQGRSISSSDAYTSRDDAMTCDVPIHGVKTVYSIIGDLFAWANIVFLILIGVGFNRIQFKKIGTVRR